MAAHKHRLVLALLIWSQVGCATKPVAACGPPLSDDEIAQIADRFLVHEAISAEFRKKAERRITPRGCNYWYEEAENLDSFGVGIVVEIDRQRHVVDFLSSQ
jgi:hypothetical protein